MPTFSARAPLFGALLVYFVLVVALILRVPPGSAPDEGAHAQYIQTILSTRALPVFQGQAPPAAGYEFHQPPLYYLLAAPLAALFPSGSPMQVYAVRALSMVFGLLTIGVVWSTANLVFSRNARAVTICTLGAALSPLHQGVGAGINNDSLAGLWAACLFYLVARIWLEGSTKRLLLLVGIVAGLGALTKLTVIALGAWAFVAVFVALARLSQGDDGSPRPLPALLPAFGVALLLAAPMLARNQILYGDPFAYGLFSRAATQGTPGFAYYSQAGISLFTYARGLAWQMLGTAWGFFGGPNTLATNTGPMSAAGPRLPPFLLLPLLVVIVVPLGGLWSEYKAPTKGEVAFDMNERSLWLWWGIAVALLVLLWANFAYAHISGGQARYLHGALLPLTLFVGGGLARTRTSTISTWLLGLTMLGLTLANVFVWQTLV